MLFLGRRYHWRPDRLPLCLSILQKSRTFNFQSVSPAGINIIHLWIAWLTRTHARKKKMPNSGYAIRWVCVCWIAGLGFFPLHAATLSSRAKACSEFQSSFTCGCFCSHFPPKKKKKKRVRRLQKRRERLVGINCFVKEKTAWKGERYWPSFSQALDSFVVPEQYNKKKKREKKPPSNLDSRPICQQQFLSSI